MFKYYSKFFIQKKTKNNDYRPIKINIKYLKKHKNTKLKITEKR